MVRKVLVLVAFVLLAFILVNTDHRESSTVVRVIDGDTVVIASGEKVRLIGIDTPERGERCYLEAKRFLESVVLFKNVSLERDSENRDRYGRLLRYIFINETLVNALILEKGLGVLYIIPPNEKYRSALESAWREGMEKYVKRCGNGSAEVS
ncbi:MAG: hypothetical protein GXO63_01445 [Candidatus Micrarchaeota archaeon]|nr:hypothetical protein [Candidatus Micrarchaeota archaeon]